MTNAKVPTTEKHLLKKESLGDCIRCKDCKHYLGYEFSDGACPMLLEVLDVEVDDDNAFPRVMAIRTPKDFGCVLGELKPVGESEEEDAERRR